MEFATFLAPVGPDDPSGVALREDPRFDELVKLTEPASRLGRATGGADRVDWNEVLEKASDLAASGRDLRLLVMVVRAGFNLERLEGLAPGFTLLTDTIEGYWPDLHPLLRERSDPREAAIGRIGALKQLENDDNGLLADLKLTPILTPRGVGVVTGEDLAGAALSEFEALNEAPKGLGEKERADLAAKHKDRVNRATVATRALNAEEPERAAAMSAALEDALGALQALSAKVSEKVGATNGASITFSDMELLLTRMRKFVTRIGEESAAASAPEPAPEATEAVSAEAAPANGTVATAAQAPAKATVATDGGINSRADVERCLDRIIAFYERTEPSSPIPHLARRMRRMVPMDFLELMAEVAPSGIKEFKSVAGVDDEKAK